MKKLGVNDLRKSYLEFFEKHDHMRLKSFSLIPHNDNSLLLINAGMAPLKPYFTGQEIPPKNRITTCQKCVRTGDIENVGKTARHLTFFEMLGNFSFGDYFKEEALKWSWEYLTEVLDMDTDRLYPSIYGEDDEAFKIWTEKIGVDADKITRFYRDENGKCDNFWEHGAGPCGPCSEIYYDRGEKYGCGKPDCKVGCECDRYMEIWNNVFTQFNGDGKGNYEELENKNIDTGMGLERLAVVVQDVDSVYDIDTLKAIRDKICDISKTEYHTDDDKDVSIRLITDHIRSSTFMISDGIMPSNEGRGYVLRRLIRRAVRHGRKLGITQKFMSELACTVIEESKDGYPELEEKKDFIVQVLTQEESKFDKTIDQGLSILSEMMSGLKKDGVSLLDGTDAFKLYDTYGFPLDLTMEILEEKGFKVDEKGFEISMKEQKEKARSARKTTNYMGAEETVYQHISPEIGSVFVGYNSLKHRSSISVITTEDEIVRTVSKGQRATIIVDETPFYGTMGGQHADVGTIQTDTAIFEVEDTIHLQGTKIGHVGVVKEGSFNVGDEVLLEVLSSKRYDICKNHSATHLLQKALREVLGNHVEQAGSYVDDERLRFDFSHFAAMTEDELKRTEDIVNEKIAESIKVITEEMTLEEAKNTGAMALFGEKYGDKVRVVKMGDFSIELCGGTHVSNTSDISFFKIISESGVAAGVRRIEALTGNGVMDYYAHEEEMLKEAAKIAKTDIANLPAKITAMQEEIKKLHSENEKLKSKAANEAAGNFEDKVKEICGIKFLAMSISDVDMNGLRNLGDNMKEKLGDGVVVLAGVLDNKVSLVVMATDNAVKSGAHAGNLIREIAPLVGGGGGGRPNMAQAGGKSPDGIQNALSKAEEVLSKQLS